MKKYLKYQAGFTLLEIVVVTSIIGLLVAVVSMSFGESRELARDSARASSLKQLQLAIEAYEDRYGEYPDKGCGVTAKWAGPGPHSASWGDPCDEYIVGLVPEFIAELPQDPSEEEVDNHGYIYASDGDDYKLMVHQTVEAKLVTSYQDELARCPRSCVVEFPGNDYCNAQPTSPQNNVYAVYSSGAICW